MSGLASVLPARPEKSIQRYNSASHVGRRMIGQTISHYRILEKLGSGGMGVVYKAQDTHLDRIVALKFLATHLLESDEHKQRFLREAKAAAALDHPNICIVHEVGEADGRIFLAMGYVDGVEVRAKIKERPLKLDEALDIAIQAAEALRAAHQKGIVHRDIKSSNLMLTSSGQVKIMDFGLAQLTGGTRLTKTDTILGTPAYMSPEQAQRLATDRRSDIWSLGVVLYEMVTGRLPFEGEREQAVVYSIINEPHEPITAVRVGVPTELDRIVGKALAKNPAERYQNVEDMLVDLRALHKSPLRGSGATAAAQSGRRKVLWAGAGVLAALLALALGLNMGGVRERIVGGPAAPSIASIAVLPLQNFSGDPEQEYFVDGMTEALIADLAKIGALKVISRTSVMRYKGTDKPLREIAAELGVDAVVEGSAQRVGDNVRITAQLIDAATDQHLWAETYDRAVTDVLGLQSEVARAIAGAIRVTLAPREQAQLAAGRRVDPGVYELVLRGQYYANRGAEEDLTKAIEYFEQAIARDPNDAPAHAGLAFSYQNLASIYRPPREVMPKAKAAALRALELDETLADAHVTLARVLLFYEWDWPETEKHLKRATELSPNSAAVHVLYSNYYTALGRPQEALAEIRFAWALDPLSLVVHNQLVFGLIAARQFDEGIAQAHQALEREPNFAFGHAAAALAYVEKGEFGRAIEEMEKANKLESNTTMTALTAHVQAAAGNRREAEKLLEGLKADSPHRYVCAYEMAHAYVKLGDKRQAFEWLEKGKQERADCMVWLLTEPWMDPLRGERQYLELLDYIGLATGKAGPKP